MQDYIPKQQAILYDLRTTTYNRLKENLKTHKDFVREYHNSVDSKLINLIYPDQISPDKLYSLASYILTTKQSFYIKNQNNIRTFDFSPWYHSDFTLLNLYIRMCKHNRVSIVMEPGVNIGYLDSRNYCLSSSNNTIISNESISPSLKENKSKKFIKDYADKQYYWIHSLISVDRPKIYKYLKDFDIFQNQYKTNWFVKLVKATRQSPRDFEQYCYICYLVLAERKNFKVKQIKDALLLDFDKYLNQKMTLSELYQNLCSFFNITPVFPDEIKKQEIELIKKKRQQKSPSSTKKFSPIVYSIKPTGDFVDVLVYHYWSPKCRVQKHKIYDVNINVPIIDLNNQITQETVPGAYCPHCGTYFITLDDYLALKLKGQILCRVLSEKAYFEYNPYNTLQPESIIKQFGYSVSQQAGLSACKR